MSVNQENQLKFLEGKTTETLTIVDAGMEEFPFGSKFVVHIQPLITGEDHFMPSPGLQNKLKDENVDKGDKITIEKVGKSDKYPYGYFSVSVVEKANLTAQNKPEKGPLHGSVEKFQEQFESKVNNLESHELALRMEKIEERTSQLEKAIKGLNKSETVKDDGLPF